MDFGQLDVVEKFWRTPELVEKLVSKLDPLSTLHLIQSGVMDKEILQKGLSLKAWSLDHQPKIKQWGGEAAEEGCKGSCQGTSLSGAGGAKHISFATTGPDLQVQTRQGPGADDLPQPPRLSLHHR